MTGSRRVQQTPETRPGVFAPALAAGACRRTEPVQRRRTRSGTAANTAESDILDGLPFEIAALDASGTIEYVNNAWRRAAQVAGVASESDAFVGTNYLAVCDRAARAGQQQAATAAAGIRSVMAGVADQFSIPYDMTHGAQERSFEMQVRPRIGGGAIVTHADATARVRAERQAAERTQELLHLSRALTMGTLSGALTHELNQPLTAILANAQAALRMLEAPEPNTRVVRDSVRDTVRAVQRASEIVRRTRNLLVRTAARREEIDINEVVQEATRLLSNEALLRGIRLTVLRALDLPAVLGDPIQLQQCVLNLVLNGFDAMNDVPTAERHLLVHTARSGKHNVEIVIEDRGIGIEPAGIDRIFDPFYTTKKDGMGMGLFITREIVRSHGGRITFRRNRDRGMRARISLISVETAYASNGSGVS